MLVSLYIVVHRSREAPQLSFRQPRLAYKYVEGTVAD